MSSFDPPYNGGGRGLFPFADALINWIHPLAANLVFLGVPTSYGYFDLVRRQPMPHQAITANSPEASSIQLFSETPLGMAAWSYGNGTTNPRGAFARTPGSQPSYNSTSMSVAASFWSYPYRGGYSGTANRLIVATSGTDNNGMLNVNITGAGAGGIGGNAGTGGVNADLTNLNNDPQRITHCLMTSFDGTTQIAQRDNGLNSSANESARGPLANIDRITIGDAAANASGRPIFWGAAWNVALSTTLRNLLTAPDGNVARNPLFGAMPRGLVIFTRKRLR